jgi:tetratricopeptide (TPR) repeat protein
MKATPSVIFGMLLLAAGCAGLTPEQRTWMADGEQAYEAQRYTDAVDRLTLVIDAVGPQRPEYARALYIRGMCRAQAGDRSGAYTDLRQCVANAAAGDVVWRAYVVLGTLHFEDGKWADAMVAYRAASDRMPRQPPKDTVLFRLGLCYERLGKWRNARTAYAVLAEELPGGTFEAEARRKLNRNAEHFSIQAGVFSVGSNAEAHVSSLRQRNLPAYVRREVHNRVPRHVVLVGQYASYDEAVRQLGRVRQLAPDAVLWP